MERAEGFVAVVVRVIAGSVSLTVGVISAEWRNSRKSSKI
jgi:hypothetical protein